MSVLSRFSSLLNSLVLTSLNVSLNFPRGNNTFPRNFCSSWKMESIWFIILLCVSLFVVIRQKSSAYGKVINLCPSISSSRFRLEKFNHGIKHHNEDYWGEGVPLQNASFEREFICAIVFSKNSRFLVWVEVVDFIFGGKLNLWRDCSSLCGTDLNAYSRSKNVTFTSWVKRYLCSSRKFRISRVQRSPSMAKYAGFSQREMWWWRGESLLFGFLSRSVHSGFPRVRAVCWKRVVRVRSIDGITVILDQEVEWHNVTFCPRGKSSLQLYLQSPFSRRRIRLH